MKKILLLAILLFSLFSCDKYDRKINRHFKKFILVDKLKDYRVENIKRNYITEGQQHAEDIKNKIASTNGEISYVSGRVVRAREEINEIKKGKTCYIDGVPYYGSKQPSQKYGFYNASFLNYSLLDTNNEGRYTMINNKEEFIKTEYAKIPMLQNKIEKLNLKLDSIKKNPSDKKVWIISNVILKGTEATGINRMKYYVQQYPNGDIKTLYRIQ